METIKVTYYSYAEDKIKKTSVNAYSLTEAIQMVRIENDFSILVVRAEWSDIYSLIKSL